MSKKASKRKGDREHQSMSRNLLIQELQSDPFLKGRRVVFQPSGKEKMSEVIAVIPHDDKQARAGLEHIINTLIKRKKRHFAECKRYIIRYKVLEAEDGWHLSVASTL